jgi:hypothetical protein
MSECCRVWSGRGRYTGGCGGGLSAPSVTPSLYRVMEEVEVLTDMQLREGGVT